MSSLDGGDQLFHLSILGTCLALGAQHARQSFLNEGIRLGSPVSGLKGQNVKVLKWFKGLIGHGVKGFQQKVLGNNVYL